MAKRDSQMVVWETDKNRELTCTRGAWPVFFLHAKQKILLCNEL
jgi:hypothetical protein